MNAPPNIDPVTAHSDDDVVHWLTNDTRDERFIDNIFAELCIRLQRLARTLLEPMSGRMPASSFWPAPPGAEAGRRCAPPS